MTRSIKILIVGNGFGGVYTVKNLHKFFHNDKRVQIDLIGEKNYFLFTPLLHEVATGGISPSNIIEPIRKILRCCLSDFHLGKTEIINTKDRTVKVGDSLISYDYLVLAPGAQTNFYNIPGAEQHCMTLKSIDDAMKIKNHLIAQMERASNTHDQTEREKILRFVVVGGGPTGVELVAEIQELITDSFSYYYKKEIIQDTSIVLVERGSELVSSFGPKIRRKSLQVLHKKNIKVMLNTAVKEITAEHVTFADNTKISTENVIWVAGVKPAELKFDITPNKSPDGRLIVNNYLELEGHKNIFAIGDVAAFTDIHKKTFLPPLAQVAEKESLMVARNIKLLIDNKNPKSFTYNSTGSMLSLGEWMAVGEIGNFTFGGHLAWWLWRTVYLSKLVSWRKKIRVAIDWTMNLFSPRDISQL